MHPALWIEELLDALRQLIVTTPERPFLSTRKQPAKEVSGQEAI
jgi:hypothetical protein